MWTLMSPASEPPLMGCGCLISGGHLNNNNCVDAHTDPLVQTDFWAHEAAWYFVLENDAIWAPTLIDDGVLKLWYSQQTTGFEAGWSPLSDLLCSYNTENLVHLLLYFILF